MDPIFIKKIYKSHADCARCPSPETIELFFTDLLGTLFPDYSKQDFQSEQDFRFHLKKLEHRLVLILCDNPDAGCIDANQVAEVFFESLPKIYERLETDVQAMFDGDPAAKSKKEVIKTYPGFYAITAYRMAHVLQEQGVQIIPRMLTEHAHSKTGIDIHPGAKIGRHFCIDHGTGVVIGETTEIGEHVKIYQGVTLGALSVKKTDASTKRHPTIEDHVVIYAGATILGGETTVGEKSIIGGNVWLSKSVPPNSKMYYKAVMHDESKDHSEVMVYRNVNV